jgi:hypothetical protein
MTSATLVPCRIGAQLSSTYATVYLIRRRTAIRPELKDVASVLWMRGAAGNETAPLPLLLT